MAALESELGLRLFQRSTCKVSLTEQGASLRQHAQRIIDLLDEAAEAMRGANARPVGRLRITCRAGLGRHLIVPWLAEFRATYPEVSVGIELVHECMTDLVNSGCDVAVTIGHMSDSSLVVKRITETDSHIDASPAYLAAQGVPIRPEDLDHHACLTLSAATGTTTWHLSHGSSKYEIPMRSAAAIDDADALIACADLGCILVADWSVRDCVERGALVGVLNQYLIEPRGTPIYVLYSSRSYVPLKVRAFIDFYSAKALLQLGRPDDRLHVR